MSKKRNNRNQGRHASGRGPQVQTTSPAVTAQPESPQTEEQVVEAQSDAITPEMTAEAGTLPADTVEVPAVDAEADAPAMAAEPEEATAAVAAETPEAAAPVAIEAAPAMTAAVPAPDMMSVRDSRGDIRGVLIQVAGARLLLPNATIAEVLSYADPDPVGGDAPDWLLGRMRWRGWHLPLIAFGRLAGVAEEKAGLGNKVVVLKALAGNAKTPYIAMLTQGFPRLVTVARETLRLDEAADAQTLPHGIQARVFLNEDEALLPDLDALEALVADAVAQAA